MRTKSILSPRERLLEAAWARTHADFKGVRDDGTRCVLRDVPGAGTCSVPLDSLTDQELAEKARVRPEDARRLLERRREIAEASELSDHDPAACDHCSNIRRVVAESETAFRTAGLDPAELAAS